MRPRAVFGVLLLFLGMVAGTLILVRLNGSTVSIEELLPSIMIMTLISIGLLIVSRQSHNAIGWILVCAASSSGLTFFSAAYARYALLTQPGTLPLGLFFGWLTTWVWVLYAIPMVTYLPLLFPSGRLLSQKWRWVAWLAGIYIAGSALLSAVQPGPLPGLEPIRNPLGLERAGDLIEELLPLTWILIVPIALVSVSALFIRFARSHGEERAQLKWFFYVMSLFLVYVVYGSISDLGPLRGLPALPEGAGTILFPAFMILFVLAIGTAILKYRLFDIDLIIRRTLLYAALTALLGLVYFVAVVGLQELFGQVSGQANSPLAIVISTLAIAALFNPVRVRLQNFIDRRFFRQKYNAEQALEAFARSARSEVDIERLSAELVKVVQETMQPQSVQLAFRKAGKAGK